jgi:predicted peptidase
VSTLTAHAITTGPLPYLHYAPVSDAKPAPLVLFLHGAGERGSDLERVKAHGLPRELGAGNPLPESAHVLAPQCPAESWWPFELHHLSTLLEDALARLPIDPTRIYLTGISMGGYGAWALAIKHPERFAALAPVCGGGTPLLAARLKALPIWAFHGAEDEVVPLEESERMVSAVNAAGGQAKLTVYPEVGHDSWTLTYRDPALYTWMFAQRRGGSRST